MKLPIVVPLDGSPAAERALVRAIAIARAIGAELHLVRASNAGTSTPGPWQLPYRTRADGARFFVAERARQQAYLHTVANRLRRTLPARHVTTAVLDGPAAQAIVLYSRRQRARLIVMTSYGSSGIRGLPLGRVADRVARMAGLPVLLIRPDAPRMNRAAVDWRCRQILVPLDGSERAQTVLEHVTSLAVAFGARVTLVSVVSPRNHGELERPPLALGFSVQVNHAGMRAAEMHVSSVAQHLRNEGLVVATRVVYGNWPPAEAIRVVARDVDADLIAIATRGRGGARRLAFGSVTASLVRSTTAPVLVLRPIDRSSARSYRFPRDATGPTIALLPSSADALTGTRSL